LRYRAGVWEEVGANAEWTSFNEVTPVADNACWLIGSNEKAPYNHLIKYADGGFTAASFTYSLEFVSYCPGLNAVFAFDTSEKGVVVGSSDGGATWREEKIELPAPYKINGLIESVATTPDALYFSVNVAVEDLNYQAIIKRTGLPGEGVYELSYASWYGPGIMSLDAVSFRNATSGVAIGNIGSIYYDGRDWIRELAPDGTALDSANLTPDPRGGFWCTSHSGRYLVWHP
jgi:hypothetical protein